MSVRGTEVAATGAAEPAHRHCPDDPCDSSKPICIQPKHEALCQLCAWMETWCNTRAAASAAVWHVYDSHRETWLRLLGDRPPQDRPAEQLGHRL